MIVGLPLRIENDTLIWLLPSTVSFIHSVNDDSDMLDVASPEIIPVSESMLIPPGRDDDAHESRYSSQ